MSSRRAPSTPGRSTRSFATHVSTTPAGPPPTWLSAKSTTPAGEPPTNARSSRFNSSYNPTKSPNRYARKNSGFNVPSNDDEDEGMYSDEDAPGADEDYGYDEYDNAHPNLPDHRQPAASFRGAMSLISAASPPRGQKRDASGKVRESSAFAPIARGQRRRPELHESDDLILETERIVAGLDVQIQRQPAQGDSILTEAVAQLTKLWAASSSTATKVGGVGPEADDAITKVNYIASLLLHLHHPHTHTPQKSAGRFQRAGANTAQPTYSVPVPRALLNWLETYHKPFPDDFDSIHLYSPSPSAHESFWDVVFASLLRGKVDRVISLLRDAGWDNADTAVDDGAPEPGYHGRQLENVEEVMHMCMQILDECPGYRYGDWDVKSQDWTVFRQRARAALEELEAFAEGDELDASVTGGNVFQRSMGASSMNLSTASRRASSRVPWTIYENLRLLYGLILGQPDEVLMTSQDWLEGALYLTIWWDGADEDNLSASAAGRSLRKNGHRTREADVAPLAAYRRRLADAFFRVQEQGGTDGDSKSMSPEEREQYAVFQVDTTDLVQVGLACVLEDEVSSAVGLLRTWSSTIEAAVTEIATLGSWLPLAQPTSRGGALGAGLSKEDLLVLSYGAPQASADGIDRDDVLSQYAEALSGKAQIGEREGWELAVGLLSRLDQTSKAQSKISELLDRLELTNENTVDKVLNVCDELGQTEQRRSIAERYADELANQDSKSYGSALVYYARAHAKEKLKDTVSLLTALCLLHSAAMPSHNLVDPRLDSLLSKDRPALKELARTDLEAATLLSSSLSGYATLRKFYDLRDQDIVSPGATSSKPLDRRRQAASALFAVLKSAADCIPGGLYDPSAETAISVDGLLALFGETLPLLGQSTRIFTQQQIFSLLALLEDFVAAPGRIRENAESLLAASLGSYREETNTATGPFRNTRSAAKSQLGDSTWELMATNSMLAVSQSLKKGESLQRAWDWRQGIVEAQIEGSQEQVVKLIREALVKEVAAGWGGKLNW